MNETDTVHESRWDFSSESEEHTNQLGKLLASVLQPGSLIALVGQLGAGKTRLVQAIAEALGADRRSVNSPTFVLLQQYDGRMPVYHFDAYRLRDSDGFLELGADELFETADGIYLIEWADRVADVLPRDRLRIHIEVTAPNSRTFQIESSGEKSAAMLDALMKLAARS